MFLGAAPAGVLCLLLVIFPGSRYNQAICFGGFSHAPVLSLCSHPSSAPALV